MATTNCVLCGKGILNYTPALNRLRLDEQRSVDICQECIEQFVKWQGTRYAKLFPTKALKKMYGKDKD